MLLKKEADFQSQINNGVVLVDFFATWCGPCKMLAPVLEELESDRSVKIVKVDVDECETLAQQYSIMSVPTLLLFKDGKLLDTKMGYMPKELITDWINKKS